MSNLQHTNQKPTRRFAFARTLAAVTAIAIAAPFGCQTEDDNSREVVQDRSFSGEQLYEGLIFGAGPVADIVPELTEFDASSLSDEERAALEAALAESDLGLEDIEDVQKQLATDEEVGTFRVEVMGQIAAADPTFFNRFADSIQSGDHLSVAAALDEAVDVTKTATQPIADAESVNQLATPSNGQGWVWAVGPVLAVVVGVALYVAVTVDVAFWGGGSALSNPGSLARDRAINLIVDRLGA